MEKNSIHLYLLRIFKYLVDISLMYFFFFGGCCVAVKHVLWCMEHLGPMYMYACMLRLFAVCNLIMT